MLYHLIICEDNRYFREKYEEIVNSVAKTININIKIYKFETYCDELHNLIYSNLENKIYILDLMMFYMKGNQIAKLIREVDLVSSIIFITSYYEEFEYDIVNGEYIYLKYINKAKEDYEKTLFETLKNIILKSNSIHTITFDIKNKLYRIIPKDINCIYTEDRKLIIKNIHNDLMCIPITLKCIKKSLPSYFKLSKNCCLVNINNIKEIDKNNRIIYFYNLDFTNLVSKKYLKSIIEEIKNTSY